MTTEALQEAGVMVILAGWAAGVRSPCLEATVAQAAAWQCGHCEASEADKTMCTIRQARAALQGKGGQK